MAVFDGLLVLIQEHEHSDGRRIDELRGFYKATLPSLGPFHSVEPAIDRVASRAQPRQEPKPLKGLFNGGAIGGTMINRRGSIVRKQYAVLDVSCVSVHARAA